MNEQQCVCIVPAGQVIVLLMSQSSHMTPGEALPPSHTHKCLQVMMYATIGGQPKTYSDLEMKMFHSLCFQESEVQLPPPPPLEGRPWVQDPLPQHDPHGWGQEG